MSPAPHPRMHGLTHVTGGPDPIPGLLPGQDVADPIMSLGPDCYWKLDEASGFVAHDSSGNDHHLTADAGTGWTPPTWGEPAGPPGTLTAKWEADTTTRVSTTTGDTIPAFTDDFTAGVWVNMDLTGAPVGEIMGQGSAAFHPGAGWSLVIHGVGTGGTSPMFAVGAATDTIVDANTPFEFGTWYFVAVVRDAGNWKLYVDGLLQAGTASTDPGSGYGGNTWLGSDGYPSHVTYLRGTRLSHAFIINRPLTSSELLVVAENPVPDTADTAGWVLGLDEDGNPAWTPPGVGGEGGGGAPDDTPVDSENVYLGDPVDGDGWHYTAHTEIAILYDSHPGRFDVPSRTWTRVPFNTVRLLRTWEVEVDGEVRQQLLTDDRGLTGHARQGMLHLADGMGYTIPADVDTVQQLEGFVYPEYPALDYDGLPASTPEGDFYSRSFRFKDVSTGIVLRNNPDPYTQTTWRRFFEWSFGSNADGKNIAVLAEADNIYPQLYYWPERPMNLPGPYPQLTAVETTAYMLNYLGVHGWHLLLQYDFNHQYSWAPGRNFVIEAWQDTPWPLRFMTGYYPNYGTRILPEWQNRPFLSLAYNYDPALIDHETGRWVG